MPDPARMEALARELSSQIGEERAPEFLERARALFLLQRSEPGSSSSEFKFAVVGVVGGAGLVGLGLWRAREDLVSEGVEIIKVSIGAYAVARGVAKAGAAIRARA